MGGKSAVPKPVNGHFTLFPFHWELWLFRLSVLMWIPPDSCWKPRTLCSHRERGRDEADCHIRAYFAPQWITEWRRLQGTPGGPSLLLKQGHPQQDAQDHLQAALEDLQDYMSSCWKKNLKKLFCLASRTVESKYFRSWKFPGYVHYSYFLLFLQLSEVPYNPYQG